MFRLDYVPDHYDLARVEPRPRLLPGSRNHAALRIAERACNRKPIPVLAE